MDPYAKHRPEAKEIEERIKQIFGNFKKEFLIKILKKKFKIERAERRDLTILYNKIFYVEPERNQYLQEFFQASSQPNFS